MSVRVRGLVAGAELVAEMHVGARTIVLYAAGEEVRREETELVRGEVNVLRP
ncbi:MAG: hypothetical protein GY711_29805 [bacterium]|nr:hypothetical protein [bacterium]